MTEEVTVVVDTPDVSVVVVVLMLRLVSFT